MKRVVSERLDAMCVGRGPAIGVAGRGPGAGDQAPNAEWKKCSQPF